MNSLKFLMKQTIANAAVWLLGVGALMAQTNPAHVQMRFANPEFNRNAGTYSLDFQMKTDQDLEKLFGINLRFFYDATKLEFESLNGLPASYSIQGDTPKAFVGNEESGKSLFSLESTTAYVNTAIQLNDEDNPLEITHKQWTKVGSLNFKVPEAALNGTTFCPSVIWDQQLPMTKSGFLPGSGGVIVTLMEEDAATRETTKPTLVTGKSFNWQLNGSSVNPFGYPISAICETLETVTAQQEVANVEKYALYQNYPNPCSGFTIIEFDLPYAQEAQLTFRDIAGRTLYAVKGDYAAGRNKVKIERDTWPVQGIQLFYQLETAKYLSQPLKMTVLDK